MEYLNKYFKTIKNIHLNNIQRQKIKFHLIYFYFNYIEK